MGRLHAEWRAAITARCSTAHGFIRLLVDVADFGAVESDAPVMEALKQFPHPIGRKKLPATEVAQELVTGSWRRLVFTAPGAEPGLADKAAYSFCCWSTSTTPAPAATCTHGGRTGGVTRGPSFWLGTAGSPRSRPC
ncbi:hypothetical protein [Streptomyces flavidovirens]|uniref:hypothetical protein n=1 Tax=Streptomyces flavidovirens TaxID=67298 RepID=UPI0036A5FA78